MSAKIVLDRGGMAAVMQSAKVQAAVRRKAEAMAAALGGIQAHDGPVPVEVTPFSAPYGDGQGVTLAHPAGVGLEAKYGYLTDAAVSAGLALGGK